MVLVVRPPLNSDEEGGEGGGTAAVSGKVPSLVGEEGDEGYWDGGKPPPLSAAADAALRRTIVKFVMLL